jgi:hypothetical protein
VILLLSAVTDSDQSSPSSPADKAYALRIHDVVAVKQSQHNHLHLA